MPDFDTRGGYESWMKLEPYMRDVAGMWAALSLLEDEIEPGDLADYPIHEAARTILTALDVDFPAEPREENAP